MIFICSCVVYMFVFNDAGELFKLGILHEAIIHSCIKEVICDATLDPVL